MSIRACLASAAIALLISSATASAATQYHLICRGGQNTSVSLDSDNQLSGDVFLSWHFEKYRGARSSLRADGSHLAPGQCSWSTNLIAARYHPWISYRTSPTQLHFFIDMWGGMNIDDGTDFGTVAYNPNTMDGNLKWLPSVSPGVTDPDRGSAFDPGMVFHFYVTIEQDFLVLQRTTWAPFP